MANLLSKINIGGVLYDLKDAYAREQIALLWEDAAKHMVTTGVFANDKAVKEYVDAQVGSINKFDVAVVDELPAASADTMYILYLVKKAGSTGDFVEYITVRSGEEGAYTYAMEQIGSTAMDLTGFVTEDALEDALQPYQPKEGLGALAFKDSASGTVEGQIISGVKATGTSTGSINVELQATEKEIASAGKFTPAGNVTGTAMTDGSINVTVAHTATAATLTKGDYTPAGTVSADFGHASADAVIERGDYTPAGTVSADFTHASTAASIERGDYTPAGEVSVALSGAEFNKITGVGTQAQFTEGEFTPADLKHEAVTANYAKEGIVGSVDGETLTFTAAGIEALTASKINSFDGGSKAKDTFVANSLPTMEAHNVGVQSSTFSGTKAEGALVTGVSYDKAALANLAFSGTKAEGALVTGVSYDKASLSNLAFAGAKAEGALVTGVSYDKAAIDQAIFTGKTVDISATFAGTEGDISVAGKANDYAVKTAEFNGASIELAVGDIAVSAKEVTVQ